MTAESTSGGPATRRGSATRLAILGAAVVAVVLLAIAATTILGRPGRQVATGVVVAVQATSLSNVQSFTIRTSDGATVDFRVGAVENATSFAPSHLAEHKATLVPVRVTWLDEGGARVAVRIEDAP